VYTLLTAPRLFTGRDDAAIEQGAVLIEGERVLAAGPASEIGTPDGPVQRIDVPNGTILPGLIDCHTHLTCSATDRMVAEGFADHDVTATIRATNHARAAVRAGVTTLRDCGSRHAVVSRLREAVRAGITSGPRMLLSGSVITTVGGHMHFVGREVRGREDLIQAIREQVRDGADFIKVTATGGGLVPGNPIHYIEFDREELTLIVDEAARLGVHVAAHTLSTESAAHVADARPRTAEHLTFYADPSERVDYDPAIVDRLVERGIWASQVIIGWHRRAHGPLGVPRPDLEPEMARKVEERAGVLRRMRGQGARFLAASDAGMPRTRFDNFGLILDLSVRHIGLSVAEAIRSATSAPATALDLADRGVLEPGRLADVAVLDGDPFEDTRAFYRCALTLIGGGIVWQAGEPGAAA
jgi:imidazolonepropionase-like amidohydrolase